MYSGCCEGDSPFFISIDLNVQERKCVMAKEKTIFYCQSCGYESTKWMGQCPGCREWNTFVEETVIATGKSGKKASLTKKQEPTLLSKVNGENSLRMSTGIREFDRVLGGGIVEGSMVLVGVIRELENLRCFFRCVSFLCRKNIRSFIYPAKNRFSRLRFGRTDSEIMAVI